MQYICIIFLLSYSVAPRLIYGDTKHATLHNYFTDSRTKASYKLAKKLTEISGLTLNDEGRLFGHNDEEAWIFEIEPADGEIIKEFYLGNKKAKKGDFEGIAFAAGKFFLVTSTGDLYRFSEGKNNEGVRYDLFKTPLSGKYDVEGLCYDPDTNCLLLVCKGFAGEEFEEMRAVYSFNLDSLKLQPQPRFLLSIDGILSKLKQNFTRKLGEFFLLIDPKNFTPSGIERHPESGTFYILSSRSQLVIELSPDGTVLELVELSAKSHHQPEGITFLKDLSLVISDEAGDKRARITIYPYHPSLNDQ